MNPKKDRTGIVAFFLRGIVWAIIGISVIILIKRGLLCFLVFYQDFAVNIGVVAFTAYLLMSERRLKTTRRIAKNTAQEFNNIEKSNGKGKTAAEYEEARNKATMAQRSLEHLENKKDITTWLLAYFAMLSAILSIFGYFMNAEPC